MSNKIRKIRKVSIPEYSFGGWIKDNKQGVLGGLTAAAGIGAMFVPGLQGVGASLIGTGVQGIAGEVQGDVAAKQAGAANQDAILAAKQQSALAATNQLRAGLSSFAGGGVVPTSYAELESGEPFRQPDGTMQYIPNYMPSHNSGGVKMKLPVGTEVLGKMKSHTGRTFKEEGTKIVKEQERLQKKLGNQPTYITENSVKLMQKKLQGHFDALMLEQESIKGSNNTTKQYQIGGYVNQDGLNETGLTGLNYFTGGYNNYHPYTPGTLNQPGQYYNRFNVVTNTPYYYNKQQSVVNNNVKQQPNNYNTPTTTTTIKDGNVSTPVNTTTPINKTVGNNTRIDYHHPLNKELHNIKLNKKGTAYENVKPVLNTDLLKAVPRSTTEEKYDYIAPGMESVPTNFAGSDTPFSSNMKASLNKAVPAIGKTMYGLSVAAPILYNLYQGTLAKTEKTRPVFNPYEGNVRSLMANRRYNINPELEQNRLTQSTYNRNVRNVSPGVGQYLGNLQAGSIGRMRADAQSYATKQNMDNQYMAQEAEMLNNLGQQKASAIYTADEANRMARANKRNYLGTALSQTQQAAQTLMRDRNMQNRDLYSTDLISQLMTNYSLESDGKGGFTFKLKE